MWQSSPMKTKNMRDMEKHWAKQREKAAKQPKPPVQPKPENENQAAQTTKETAEKT